MQVRALPRARYDKLPATLPPVQPRWKASQVEEAGGAAADPAAVRSRLPPPGGGIAQGAEWPPKGAAAGAAAEPEPLTVASVGQRVASSARVLG
eukprot:COSAG01_NODE_1024_length_12058_cov_91.598211_1_plen_93_part_10